MSGASLTGSRLRDRRMISGMRQAELAREVGISASYLNLIEHNRRRIGGKLLVDLARVLDVDPSILTEGAEAALIATLREVAVDLGDGATEIDRVEEFAGRFPGWAQLISQSHKRMRSLERTVEALADRLTHDPHLSSSLHEVLSTAAAIRSVSSILAETDELEPEWRDRFHRNLNQDSGRLAESSKALMAYLDDSADTEVMRRLPREEVDGFLAAEGYHFPELEKGSVAPEEIVDAAPVLTTSAARQIAMTHLEEYKRDAVALPFDELRRALGDTGIDPDRLAQQLGVSLPVVMRRLAAMPAKLLGDGVGLVSCDAAGSLLSRRPIDGFSIPRTGAPCPIWPLFVALSQPLVPVRRNLVQLGRSPNAFACIAVAAPTHIPGPEEDPIYRAWMLIRPLGETSKSSTTTLRNMGSSCRVCPHPSCSARREASILNAEL